jgi:DNA repair protein RecN (Recombination protein N)
MDRPFLILPGYDIIQKMLRELRIRNFAIVDSINLSFDKGLNVITGETGAGKSIIVNALELIFGGRASSEVVKAGTNEAWIEAFLEITDSPLLQSLDIPCDDGVVARRIINKNGKSRAYINDHLVTIQLLNSFGKDLIDLHGQHEHQSLLSTSVQRDILDSFGELDDRVQEIKKLFNKYQALNTTFSDMKTRQREREQKLDVLKYQISEIDSLELEKDEKERLLEERAILSNISHLKYLSETAFNHLKDGDDSLVEKLAATIKLISEMNRIDGSSEDLLKSLQEAESLIQDSIFAMRDIKDRYESDPLRLDVVESRLASVEKLERKYGEGIDGILEFRERAASELIELEGLQERSEEIEKEANHTHSLLLTKSQELSRIRKKTSDRLGKRIGTLLREVAFSKPVFKIEQSTTPLSATGIDRVDFLFSANPGQPPKALNKIASGGELSRVMLALKSVFTEVDKVDALIFDEVDAGVGGKTADSLAKLLKKLSDRHQVLCITHLPQIASRADNHLYITKGEETDRVIVKVSTLKGKERLREIARMMSGAITDTSLRHAEELLLRS